MAQGINNETGIVFVRTALGAKANDGIQVNTIVGRLDDGSTTPCTGLIDWLPAMPGTGWPGGRCVLGDVVRNADQLVPDGPSGVAIKPLRGYSGPISQFGEPECKLALRFPAEVARRIKAVRVAGNWI